MAVADGTSVHLYDATGAETATKDLTTDVLGLDVATGGALYVTRDDGAGAVVVTVLDGGTLSQTNEVGVPGSAVPAASVVLADGRLLVLQSGTGALAVFTAALETGSTTAPTSIAVDKGRGLLATHPTKATAYVAADAASADPAPTRVDAVDVDAATVAPLATLAGTARLTGLAASADGSVAHVLVLRDDASVAALAAGDGATEGVATLAGTAAHAAGAPWTWVVASSGGQSLLQPVGVPRLAAGTADAVGPSLAFAGDARGVTVDAGDGTVYVPYADGVAVFTVTVTLVPRPAGRRSATARRATSPTASSWAPSTATGPGSRCSTSTRTRHRRTRPPTPPRRSPGSTTTRAGPGCAAPRRSNAPSSACSTAGAAEVRRVRRARTARTARTGPTGPTGSTAPTAPTAPTV